MSSLDKVSPSLVGDGGSMMPMVIQLSGRNGVIVESICEETILILFGSKSLFVFVTCCGKSRRSVVLGVKCSVASVRAPNSLM